MSSAGYKDTKIGRIPKEWGYTKITELATQIGTGPFGSSIKKDTYTDSGIPVISGMHMTNMELKEDKFEYISLDHANKLIRSNVYRGDVIFTLSGTVGQVAYIQKSSNFSRYILSQRQFYIRLDQHKITPYYCTSFFKSYNGQKIINSNTARIGVPSIIQPTSFIKSVKIPVPPLPEQHKIAEILSTVDEAIKKTDQIIEETKQLKKGLMQKLFTEGIGHTRYKETKIGRIPEEWKIINAKDICSKVTDGTHDTPKAVDDGKLLIMSKNIKSGLVTFDDAYKISLSDFFEINRRSKVDQYDVLYGMIGASVGYAALVVDDNVDFAIKNVGLFKSGGSEVLGRWLFNYFSSNKAHKFVYRHKGGAARDFAPLSLLRKFPVPVPNKTEMHLINSILLDVDAKIETEQVTKDQLEQLKKGLMQVLLTGQVRVKV